MSVVQSGKEFVVGCYQKSAQIIFSAERFRKRPFSRVLIYHEIGKDQLTAFQTQLEILAQFYRFCTARELVDLYRGNGVAGQPLCVITFDDGFSDVVERAVPVLKKMKIPATIFLNLRLYELTEKGKEEDLAEYLNSRFPRVLKKGHGLKGITTGDIRQLLKSGFEIGGHTVNHPNLASLCESDIRSELTKPIAEIKRLFDYDLATFAYPYGRRANINSLTKTILAEAGYRGAFSGISNRLSERMTDFMEIPRTSVSLNWSSRYFYAMLAGSEDLKDRLLGQR